MVDAIAVAVIVTVQGWLSDSGTGLPIQLLGI
jgi:hypothetical protein